MRGIQRNAAHCSEIRKLLQEIDPLFDIAFNFDNETYIVDYNGGIFETLPHQDLDREWMAETKHTYWLNKTGRMMDYIDEGNAKYEKSEEKKLTDMARDMAENMRKPLIETHYYGG